VYEHDIFRSKKASEKHKEYYVKGLFYTILMFPATLCMIYANGNDVWDYYEKNGYAIITNYRGNDTKIAIPSCIEGLPVLEIQNYQYKGPYALIKVVLFGDGRLISVTIPHCVTSIGIGVFAGNLLTNVDIGANVALDIDAIPNGFVNFYNNNGKKEGKYIYKINGAGAFKQPAGTEKL
jgi:hypothetical protein